ncbi:MAG: hypothetical protein LBR14_00825 [Clostridiales Family XIII bacterium]|jgi:hypothetical protein|nr:hypothetical protein [Clostridiales Family XIII bacterium]
MKRLMIILCAAVALLAFAGCGNEGRLVDDVIEQPIHAYLGTYSTTTAAVTVDAGEGVPFSELVTVEYETFTQLSEEVADDIVAWILSH